MCPCRTLLSGTRSEARATYSFSTSRIFGTDTRTDTRRDLTCAAMVAGLDAPVRVPVSPTKRRRGGAAERQRGEEPQRKERPSPLAVLEHLAFDGDDVRQDVAVGDDDALRI